MKELGYGIAALALLTVLYVGSYYAIIVPGRITLDGFPEYRFGGEAAHLFFRPAFEFDRWIRPRWWLLNP